MTIAQLAGLLSLPLSFIFPLHLTTLANPLRYPFAFSFLELVTNILLRIFSVHILGGNSFCSFFSAAFQRWCFDQMLFGFSVPLIFGLMIFDQSHDQTWLLTKLNSSNK